MTEQPLSPRLIALEQQLFQGLIRRSPQALNQLLADDFIEIPSTGVAFNKDQVLNRLPNEIPPKIEAWDFQVRLLAPTLAQITYQSMLQRPCTGQAVFSLRSSLWRLEGGQWRMCFHQGTVKC